MSLRDHFRRAPDSAPILAPPPLIVAATVAAGLACGRYWALPLPALAQDVLAPAGWLLAALAGGLAAWAAFTFAGAGTAINPFQTTTQVVARGPYRFSRNPMYVSLLGLQAGLSGMLAEPWLLAWLLPAWAALRWGVIAHEEEYLGGKFGAEYDAYRERVRRWL